MMSESSVIRGFRCYKAIVRLGQRDIALMGARDHVWEEATLQAQCGTDGYNPEHPTTRAQRHLFSGEHDCGIYVYKDPIHVVERYGRVPLWLPPGAHFATILAQTLLWGAVEEGEKGYRAQFARVESLDILAPAAGGCSECSADHILTTVTRHNTQLKWDCDKSVDGKGQDTVSKVVNGLALKYQVPVRVLRPDEYARVYGPKQVR